MFPEAEPQLIRLEDGATVPNNPDLPVVLVPNALTGASAPEIRARFEAMGWMGTWTSVVFAFHHFHPDAHEALCVASGWGDIMLGGPGGRTLRLKQGDLVVLPAGTGHCRTASSADFTVCGGYPQGQQAYSLLRESQGARARFRCPIPIRSSAPPDR